MCFDINEKEEYEEESNKSLDQVLYELNKQMVGQERKIHIKMMIENSQSKLEEYKNDSKRGIEQELERIRNFKQKDGIDVFSSCLSVVLDGN